MTTLEAKVKKYSRANNMKSNNVKWHVLENAVCNGIELAERRSFIDYTQWGEILDKATEGIKNPENWAVRDEIIESMKLMGWVFYSNAIVNPN